MEKRVLWWMLMLAFSWVACKGERLGENGERLCEKGDESCEVGNGKCVVGYDGDCFWGRVCYADEGAPKGKPGTCTDGQFNANGKLIAVVEATNFEQAGRSVGPINPPWLRQRECFAVCPSHGDPMPPLWLGRAPATLTVIVKGPQAETEQLKALVRGVEHKDCVPTASSPGQREWECSFAEEDWAGKNTQESLKLKLWTESSQDFPWISSYHVDTQPMELEDLSLEARVEEGFLEVAVDKKDAGRWNPSLFGSRALLYKVYYSNLEIFLNSSKVSEDWKPITQQHFPERLWKPRPDYRTELPADLKPGDILEIHTTVNASDLAGNEVSHADLTTTLTL